jgi:hypothetical protein
LRYLEIKKEEMEIMKQICVGQDANKLMQPLKDVRSKANETFQELLKL